MRTIYCIILMVLGAQALFAQKSKAVRNRPVVTEKVETVNSSQTELAKPSAAVKQASLLKHYTTHLTTLAALEPADQDPDSFNIVRRGLQNALKQEKLRRAIQQHTADLQADFTKLNNLLASEETAELFFRNKEFRDTLAFKKIFVEQTAIGAVVDVGYSQAVSAACRNGRVSVDTTGDKAINRYIKTGQLQIKVFNQQSSCAEIDRFPKVQITEEYGDHLHSLITEVLDLYPKFNTSIAEYDAKEASNNFALKDKINYRIKFIKYCYDKI
jgi:hypothetical protein